jgi:hypothetical protein
LVLLGGYLQSATSRNRWQQWLNHALEEPRQSVPALGFVGPALHYKRDAEPTIRNTL